MIESILAELKFYGKFLSILIVEDEKKIASELHGLLKKIFKKCDVAYDGLEALELYNKNAYDIIVTDINMPKLNGLELTKKIKAKNKNQCILIFSAYIDTFVIDLIDLGINGLILKPFKIDKFFQVLSKNSENIMLKKDFQKAVNGQKYKRVVKKQSDTIVKVDSHKLVSGKNFIDDLKSDSIAWNSIKSQLDELLELIQDFENLIEKIFLNEISNEILEEISFVLERISFILKSTDILLNISEVILQLSEFLYAIKVEELSLEQKEKLKILEYIHDDLSRFIQSVFIEQDTLDIYYLEDSFKSSLEQLKMNILNEKIEEEEIDFF
ncbi:hypothetical protein CPG37_11575 [Malaciobacter canalis]|uniref:Response regulatory domain-containing protein n=1 Tax=Malaciobacter canalis TaxID=1912871 RepID=A0ABX4LM79_9BACT|nr:response regulator [Malaciobacter canalis]PHO08959.1 hypothetical protein CPG37_11575 [Malaciobacter canalis]QEE32731.1 response regulator receiver domain-containing protein [Malaciobacter canalis]